MKIKTQNNKILTLFFIVLYIRSVVIPWISNSLYWVSTESKQNVLSTVFKSFLSNRIVFCWNGCDKPWYKHFWPSYYAIWNINSLLVTFHSTTFFVLFFLKQCNFNNEAKVKVWKEQKYLFWFIYFSYFTV